MLPLASDELSRLRCHSSARGPKKPLVAWVPLLPPLYTSLWFEGLGFRVIGVLTKGDPTIWGSIFGVA